MEIRTALTAIVDYLRAYYPPRANGKTIVTDALNTIFRYVNEHEDHDNKYRWHDLRKDPKDLPKDGERVFVSSKGYRRIIYSVDSFTENLESLDEYNFEGTNRGGFYYWDSEYGCIEDTDVMGWKYIEPFEESGNEKNI